MTGHAATSDGVLMDLLRQGAGMTIHEIADAMGVTATAVRQRLTRLMAQGLVERRAERVGRGRPNHVYELTRDGERSAGSNFSDLAMALWQELRAIPDPAIRRGLLARVSQTMAGRHSAAGRPGDPSRPSESRVGELTDRMEGLSAEYRRRAIPFAVDTSGDMPVLNAFACPYPELAEQDHSICAMERLLFSEIVGEPLKLSKCRVAGDHCCSFEPSSRTSSPDAADLAAGNGAEPDASSTAQEASKTP